MWELCGARLSRENVQIVRLTGGENVLGAEQALSARMWTVFEIALQARVVSWSQCEQFQLCTRSHCTPNCAMCTSRTIKVAEELYTSWPHFVPTLCSIGYKVKCRDTKHQSIIQLLQHRVLSVENVQIDSWTGELRGVGGSWGGSGGVWWWEGVLGDSYGFTAFHCGGGSLGQHLSPDFRKIIKICSRLYAKHLYFRAYHDVITKGFNSIVLERERRGFISWGL